MKNKKVEIPNKNKKRYQAPQLIDFGSVRQLTLENGSPFFDGIGR